MKIEDKILYFIFKIRYNLAQHWTWSHMLGLYKLDTNRFDVNTSLNYEGLR